MLGKRLAVLVAMALMLAMMAASPAFADKGGIPNGKACQGQTVSILNRVGETPPENTDTLWFPDPGFFHYKVNKGSVEFRFDSGGRWIGCSFPPLYSQAEIRATLVHERPIPHGNQHSPPAFTSPDYPYQERPGLGHLRH